MTTDSSISRYPFVQSGTTTVSPNGSANNAIITYNFGESVPNIIATVANTNPNDTQNNTRSFFVSVSSKTATYASFSVTEYFGGSSCGYTNAPNLSLNWKAVVPKNIIL